MVIVLREHHVPTYLLDWNVGEINCYAKRRVSVVERDFIHEKTQPNLKTECLQEHIVSQDGVSQRMNLADLSNASTGSENSCDLRVKYWGPHQVRTHIYRL